MKINRRYLTAGATFFLAAATGHVMQNGSTYAGMIVGTAEPQAESSALSDAAVTEIVPVSADASDMAQRDTPLLPSAPEANPLALGGGVSLSERIRTLDAGSTRDASAADLEYSAFGMPCETASLSISPADGGMLRVKISAPCDGYAAAAVFHAGISVPVIMDAQGTAEAVLPVLDPKGTVTLRTDDGTSAEAAVPAMDLTKIMRAALVWNGPDALALSAYENGASYGKKGYVADGVRRGLGTVDVLSAAGDGNPPRAEVYTGPADLSSVTFDIVADVTDETCGVALQGRLVQLRGGKMSSDAFQIAMPDCGATGDRVVLSVPVSPGMTVASN